MPPIRPRPDVPTPPRPNVRIPADQERALDRRQALDYQQRTFAAPRSQPSRPSHRRPPA